MLDLFNDTQNGCTTGSFIPGFLKGLLTKHIQGVPNLLLCHLVQVSLLLHSAKVPRKELRRLEVLYP